MWDELVKSWQRGPNVPWHGPVAVQHMPLYDSLPHDISSQHVQQPWARWNGSCNSYHFCIQLLRHSSAGQHGMPVVTIQPTFHSLAAHTPFCALFKPPIWELSRPSLCASQLVETISSTTWQAYSQSPVEIFNTTTGCVPELTFTAL